MEYPTSFARTIHCQIVIRFQNVTKSHALGGLRRHLVLSQLSFELTHGTNLAVLGRNGAGKSTLLRLMGKVDVPDAGIIETKGAISPPLGLRSGFAPRLTGCDNAKFICRIQGAKGAALSRKIEEIESYAALGKFFHEPVETYSSGMKARLAFASSLAFHYDYLLVDELTSVGDQGFREKASAAFERLRGECSIVLVSHNLKQLLTHCDKALYIRSASEFVMFDDVKSAIAVYRADLKSKQASKSVA